MSLDIDAVRSRFPALQRTEGGEPVAHLDGPAGTQVPIDVIDATDRLLRMGASNVGGPFGASRDAGDVVAGARTAMADMFSASPDEIVFGQSMTSLTFAASRAIARRWTPKSRVVVTDLDHDANRTPWIAAARDRGAEIDSVPFDPTTGTLHPADVIARIDPATELVAVTAASNALGSVTDLGPIVAAAHEAGALVYVDAVHASAHRINDVAALGADFLVASAYKFFGPHTGVLFGRREHLEAVDPYKLVPAPDTGPGRWETGTLPFESLVGVTAAVDYLAGLGSGGTRRERLVSAFDSIRAHEEALGSRFLAGVAEIPGLTLHGPADGDRVATFAVTLEDVAPDVVAARLGEQGIYTWSGDYYAVRVMETLGLARTGGAVRIGFVHYTSEDEVDRVLQALAAIA